VSQTALVQIRRGHEAFNNSDLPALVELAAPDVVWGSSVAFAGLAGRYEGHNGLRQWLVDVRDMWETFEVTLGEILRADDGLIVVEEHLRGRGRISGAEAEMSLYTTYWFDAEGRIRQRQVFVDRESALEAAAA
jgi:ketosteroid isomerase-like protein